MLVKNLDRDDNEFFDIVDKMVNEKVFSEKYKICSSCNESAPITQHVCKVCKNELDQKKPVLIKSFAGKNIDPYNHFKVVPCQILLKLQLENLISKLLIALKQFLK